MDILKILQESTQDITNDDLLMFEDAISSGDYENESNKSLSDALYRQKCINHITRIRNRLKTEDKPNPKDENRINDENKNSGVIISGVSLSPFNAPVSEHKSITEEVASELSVMRRTGDYKKQFRDFLLTSEVLTEEFIDNNFLLFEQFELDCMLSEIPFTEAFLEKRFAQLNHEEIAKNQFFSEEFFMRHFAELDAEIILQKGVNPWRIKSNRSNKLDVFLRLKGIR